MTDAVRETSPGRAPCPLLPLTAWDASWLESRSPT
jgi:hypothetical protein